MSTLVNTLKNTSNNTSKRFYTEKRDARIDHVDRMNTKNHLIILIDAEKVFNQIRQ